jgi:hypothetical protein
MNNELFLYFYVILHVTFFKVPKVKTYQTTDINAIKNNIKVTIYNLKTNMINT